MKFLIPSYKRPDKQDTLFFLRDLGYRDIVISVQTEEDYAKYTEKYGNLAKIIKSTAHNVAGNRNALLRTLKVGERAVLIDDDLKNIKRLIAGDKPKWYVLKTREEYDLLFEECFSEMESVGAKTFGFYNADNAMFCNASSHNGTMKYSYDRVFPSTVFGVEMTGQLFDERYDTKEDFQYLLRQLSKGIPILRVNIYSPTAGHFTKGGCEEWWQSDKKIRCAKMLCKEFPEYVIERKDKIGEIRQRKVR